MNNMDKFLNIAHKIILCVASFACTLVVTVLLRVLHEILLPSAPDWPVLIIIGCIGYSWATLAEHIIKKVKFE